MTASHVMRPIRERLAIHEELVHVTIEITSEQQDLFKLVKLS